MACARACACTTGTTSSAAPASSLGRLAVPVAARLEASGDAQTAEAYFARTRVVRHLVAAAFTVGQKREPQRVRKEGMGDPAAGRTHQQITGADRRQYRRLDSFNEYEIAFEIISIICAGLFILWNIDLMLFLFHEYFQNVKVLEKINSLTSFIRDCEKNEKNA